MKIKRKLTVKQKRFCDEYLKDLNASRAAKTAGYSQKTADIIGYQLLRKTLVAEYLQSRMDKRSKKTEIDAEYVLTGIKKIAENSAALIETEQGQEVRNATAALKSYELLGKHLVLFADKKIVDADVKVALSGFNYIGE
jgi:phage terminase small subunit